MWNEESLFFLKSLRMEQQSLFFSLPINVLVWLTHPDDFNHHYHVDIIKSDIMTLRTLASITRLEEQEGSASFWSPSCRVLCTNKMMTQSSSRCMCRSRVSIASSFHHRAGKRKQDQNQKANKLLRVQTGSDHVFVRGHGVGGVPRRRGHRGSPPGRPPLLSRREKHTQEPVGVIQVLPRGVRTSHDPSGGVAGAGTAGTVVVVFADQGVRGPQEDDDAEPPGQGGIALPRHKDQSGQRDAHEKCH